MKEQLREAIKVALQQCYNNGRLGSGQIPDEIQLEVPKNPDHGDFASNLAMTMAKAERKAPRQIAEALVEVLQKNPLCERVEIAGPGFINFRLAPSCWYGVLDQVMSEGEQYGRSDVGKGTKIQVEFVSANPTGPLHIGHGRGAVVGDAVAAVLQAAGYDVQREYYVNDAGNQVKTLGLSILMRLRELQGESIEFPEDGYQAEYVKELAAKLQSEKGELKELEEDEAIEACARFGVEKVLEWIGRDLKAFGIEFDNWYSEKSLYDRNMVDNELAKLKEKGLSFEQDEALWLRTTEYGDDKDRVLIKSDGSYTYFASDVAYHMEKFERGFDRVIDVWGADHHGYIPRMKAMLAGLGHPPEDLEVLLIQMVNLLRDGQPFTMGKRSGNFITLREVIDEVGSDAARFFFLIRRCDSQLDFDLELAKQQNSDNPVYYVQYAHARVCSINRNAAEAGIALPKQGEADLSKLELPEEMALAQKLARFQEMIVGAAQNYEPHRVVFYLQELAAQFHSYYNRQKVLVEDAAVTQARLYLVNSVRIVLANALHLLGVSAPEQM
ncbi:arginyl-tRNA synthetase [Malonomonas rubra DSM 5091]|uniref:Arginine--tRNA ligase n=1 Tax=Malonomonas rubra DSM 5091 TaxID=1122189 RepID=A0A1M6F1H6_MALRU|nr:arginine--tRNA ligase [Malonomonas rubra]SHI91584.1 arginyl-tRNA synthetase [Malonomonas rubra DSM 5091]